MRNCGYERFRPEAPGRCLCKAGSLRLLLDGMATSRLPVGDYTRGAKPWRPVRTDASPSDPVAAESPGGLGGTDRESACTAARVEQVCLTAGEAAATQSQVAINVTLRKLKSVLEQWGRQVSSDGNATGTQHHLEQIAGEVLSTFGKIVQKADHALNEGQSLTSDAFGTINTFTSEATQRSQDRINRANQESYRHLKAEPAIARIVIEDSNSQKSTYYFLSLRSGDAQGQRYTSPPVRPVAPVFSLHP